MKQIVTVFTPTYNRAYILPNAYESLKRQTDKRFEWIIVDDGSTDNTKKLVSSWTMENNNFPIKYYFQENCGKHIAINYGVKVAEGILFLILDSDDYLRDDAIEQIINYASEISQEKHYGGVVGNRAHFNSEIIGSTFNGKVKDMTFLEKEKKGISGDKAEVFFINVLKQYPFPKIKNEKFCTEALVWNRIAKDGWILRFFNENIYFTEYLEDGLSAKYWKLMYENPIQASIFYVELSRISNNFSIKTNIVNRSLAVIFSYQSGKSIKEIKKDLNINYVEYLFYFILGLMHKVKNNG